MNRRLEVGVSQAEGTPPRGLAVGWGPMQDGAEQSVLEPILCFKIFWQLESCLLTQGGALAHISSTCCVPACSEPWVGGGGFFLPFWAFLPQLLSFQVEMLTWREGGRSSPGLPT